MVIVGAGAIGSWLAVRLALAGDGEVTLLARPARAEAIRRTGLRLEVTPAADPAGRGHSDHVTVPPLAVVDDATRLPASPGLVVFAVRAYQTKDAAHAVQSAGVSPRIVLTLQNGLGNAEALADVFGAGRVLAGTTTHGVTWLGPALARHAGAGDTTVGPWRPEAHPSAIAVAERFARAGIATSVAPDPRPALWLKVAVNAAINPPTAIHGIENGRLLDGGDLERDLEASAREVAAVASAEGVQLDAEVCVRAARTVAARTAANLSSMLQALRAGRPLETEAILGEVVRRARRHGLPVQVVARHYGSLVAPRAM